MSQYSLYIAALSLLVSSITLYLTQFQRPKISFHPGSTFGFCHTKAGFELYAPITFVNSSQRTGIVHKCAVLISFPGDQSKSQYIEWTEFNNYDYSNKKYYRETFAGPFATAAKSSEHRIVLFGWKQAHVLFAPGTYRITFYIWTSDSGKPNIVSPHNGELSDQSAADLSKFRSENKPSIRYFSIDQQIESNKTLTRHEVQTLLGTGST